MNTLYTKWGSITVALFIIGVITLSLVEGTKGVSTWFTDSYLPKKYLIAEKYPVRVILYGQFEHMDQHDMNTTVDTRSDTIIAIIEALDKVQHQEGNFVYPISVNVESQFNSKQIRSKQRSPSILEESSTINPLKRSENGRL